MNTNKISVCAFLITSLFVSISNYAAESLDKDPVQPVLAGGPGVADKVLQLLNRGAERSQEEPAEVSGDCDGSDTADAVITEEVAADTVGDADQGDKEPVAADDTGAGVGQEASNETDPDGLVLTVDGDEPTVESEATGVRVSLKNFAVRFLCCGSSNAAAAGDPEPVEGSGEEGSVASAEPVASDQAAIGGDEIAPTEDTERRQNWAARLCSKLSRRRTVQCRLCLQLSSGVREARFQPAA